MGDRIDRSQQNWLKMPHNEQKFNVAKSQKKKKRSQSQIIWKNKINIKLLPFAAST